MEAIWLFVVINVQLHYSFAQDIPRNVPQWSLDPFLGVYDLDLSSRIPADEFAKTVLDVPISILEKGERQVFNKTDDGTRYQHFVLRSEAKYNIRSVFLLDKKTTVTLDSGSLLTSGFTMLNASVLQGSYSLAKDSTVVDFVITFAFSQDANALVKTVNILYPQEVQTTALFRRVNSEPVLPTQHSVHPATTPAPEKAEPVEISKALYTGGETVSHL